MTKWTCKPSNLWPAGRIDDGWSNAQQQAFAAGFTLITAKHTGNVTLKTLEPICDRLKCKVSEVFGEE